MDFFIINRIILNFLNIYEETRFIANFKHFIFTSSPNDFSKNFLKNNFDGILSVFTEDKHTL